jgi:hypothetical protein
VLGIFLAPIDVAPTAIPSATGCPFAMLPSELIDMVIDAYRRDVGRAIRPLFWGMWPSDTIEPGGAGLWPALVRPGRTCKAFHHRLPSGASMNWHHECMCRISHKFGILYGGIGNGRDIQPSKVLEERIRHRAGGRSGTLPIGVFRWERNFDAKPNNSCGARMPHRKFTLH